MVKFNVGDWIEFEHDEGITICKVISKSSPEIVKSPRLRMFSGRTPFGRHVGDYCNRVIRVLPWHVMAAYELLSVLSDVQE